VSPAATTPIEVGGRTLKLSNLDKVLWPQSGFTKGQMIDYYMRISTLLLPHLSRRPLTLKRYPDGVIAEFFYEKQCPTYRPAWLATCPIPSRSISGKVINYCVVDDLPSLVWVANLASIELHPLLACCPHTDRPTALAFDLDPGPPAGLLDCCRVGLWVKDVLDRLSLRSFPKTSGSKGLQVYVPLNTAHTYDDTKPFARTIARFLEREHPDQVVERMDKSLRKGKVLIDWSQNDLSKSTVSVYSLRAQIHPTVSTPASWLEVQQALNTKHPEHLQFEAPGVLRRIEQLGDLFAPVRTLRQRLPRIS
jgi:bifunctional non-homologous end joining protein LigD